MTDHAKDHDAMLAGAFAPRAATSVMQASARDYTNSYVSASMRNGQVVDTSVGNVSQSSIEGLTSKANVAANVPWSRAISPQGNHVSPHDVKDDTVLFFPNFGEVTLAQARNLPGLLPPGWRPNGSYSDQMSDQRQERVSQGANHPFDVPPAEIPQADVHPDLDTQPLSDPAAEQSLNDLVTNIAGMETYEGIRQIVENGEIDEQTLTRAASQLRIEPGQLQERLGPIMKGMEDQARAVMSEGGVNADDVIAFAQTHRRDALNIAMNKQAKGRNTNAYAAIRADYLASLGDMYPERALDADLGNGLKASKNHQGKIIVNVPGYGEMSWRSAIQTFAQG